MCTIPAAERALAEIRRVLRPGGAFHFVEHGLSPEQTVARWQHLLTPLQRRVFGGCHIDRPIDRLVAGAGLELTRLDNYYLKGPHPFGYMFDGVPTKPPGQQCAALTTTPNSRSPKGGHQGRVLTFREVPADIVVTLSIIRRECGTSLSANYGCWHARQ